MGLLFVMLSLTISAWEVADIWNVKRIALLDIIPDAQNGGKTKRVKADLSFH